MLRFEDRWAGPICAAQRVQASECAGRRAAPGEHRAPQSGLPPRLTRFALGVADLTIDDTPDRVAIDAQLAELERRARATGFAIGLANGYPVTIERLADWSLGLPERNFALAPVSAIVNQQPDR